MLKIIIATSDLLSCKELINQCIAKIPTVKIINISNSEKEFEYYKNNLEFDIILFHNFNHLDYDLHNNDIICIGKFKSPVKRYERRISLSNQNSFEFLRKKIQGFIKKVSLSIVREKSTQILLDLGFSFKHIGTKYIVDAICYSYINRCETSFENFKKDIYPYIAKNNHTHIENVSWSIARTINLMYLNHTTKSILQLEEFFCLDHMQKPTPKQVIGLISNKLFASIPIS